MSNVEMPFLCHIHGEEMWIFLLKFVLLWWPTLNFPLLSSPSLAHSFSWFLFYRERMLFLCEILRRCNICKFYSCDWYERSETSGWLCIYISSPNSAYIPSLCFHIVMLYTISVVLLFNDTCKIWNHYSFIGVSCSA